MCRMSRVPDEACADEACADEICADEACMWWPQQAGCSGMEWARKGNPLVLTHRCPIMKGESYKQEGWGRGGAGCESDVTPGVAGIWAIKSQASQVPNHGPYQEPSKSHSRRLLPGQVRL